MSDWLASIGHVVANGTFRLLPESQTGASTARAVRIWCADCGGPEMRAQLLRDGGGDENSFVGEREAHEPGKWSMLSRAARVRSVSRIRWA